MANQTIGDALNYDVSVKLKASQWNDITNILLDVAEGYLDSQLDYANAAQILCDNIKEQMDRAADSRTVERGYSCEVCKDWGYLHLPSDDPHGFIERCDNCERYESDEDAAEDHKSSSPCPVHFDCTATLRIQNEN